MVVRTRIVAAQRRTRRDGNPGHRAIEWQKLWIKRPGGDLLADYWMC